MKHRNFSIIIALTLCFGLLAGCGSTSGKGEETQVNLNEFYTSLAETYEMQFGMEEADEDLTNNFYSGLNDIETLQQSIYITMMTMATHEVALVQVADEKDVDAVKAIFQTRVDDQVNGGAWYPMAIEEWDQNSRIASNGRYVMLAVHPDSDDIVDQFNALFA